jgi:hypothetical protein
MTVYVDDMFRYPLGQFGRMKMSHMIADTPEELHAMADRIGVARRWFQGDHYDVSMALRTKAVAVGAKEITLRECSLMTLNRRRDPNAPLLTPEEGQRLLRARGDSRERVS